MLRDMALRSMYVAVAYKAFINIEKIFVANWPRS
jgi:hypothetical protein